MPRLLRILAVPLPDLFRYRLSMQMEILALGRQHAIYRELVAVLAAVRHENSIALAFLQLGPCRKPRNVAAPTELHAPLGMAAYQTPDTSSTERNKSRAQDVGSVGALPPRRRAGRRAWLSPLSTSRLSGCRKSLGASALQLRSVVVSTPRRVLCPRRIAFPSSALLRCCPKTCLTTRQRTHSPSSPTRFTADGGDSGFRDRQ